MNFHQKLLHFLTEYDKKQSKKLNYNKNALGLYFEAAETANNKFKECNNIKESLDYTFNDKLYSYLKKKFEI